MDSNVLITSNGGSDLMAECAASCARFLLAAQSDHVILEDTSSQVFDEYRRYCNLAGQPGPGDFFLRWYFHNRFGTERVVQVPIPSSPGELAECLPGPLQALDNDDHKWVAIYLAGEGEALYNATDSDWSEFAQELIEADVNVVELCG